MSFRLPRAIPPNFQLPPNRSFILGSPINTFQVSMPFAAFTCIMVNNTSNPFYLTIGSRRIPTVNDTQWVCPAAVGGVAGSLQIPVGLVSEFAGFLPLTPALTDLTAKVFITFQG